MKTLGINIDGVLRSHLDQFDKQYRKAYIANENPVEMTDDFKFKELTTEEYEVRDENIKSEIQKRIFLPVDTLDLLNHYKFSESIDLDGETKLSPKQSLEKFMYETYPFQIFGQAEEFEKASATINRIQNFGEKNKLFDVILLSTLKSQAIAATYYFLFKVHTRVKNVKFLEEDYLKW